jgi:hypothetical protein
VRITQRELFVYAADLRCVARHELAPRGAGMKLDPAGLHPPPQRKSPADLDQLGVAFGHMGEGAAEFFRLLSAGPPRVWGWQARRILQLRERYPTDELDLALGHAAAFGALDHASVERIVAARALPRTLDEYVAEDTARRLEETFGHVRTQARDLTEYDRLPITSASRSRTEEKTKWPDETQPTPDVPSAPETTTHSCSSDSDDTSSSSD